MRTRTPADRGRMRLCQLLWTLCAALPAVAQSWEQPRQQIDFYGGGGYQVGVTGTAVLGTQVRVNTGRYLGIGGFYNFAPGRSIIGATLAGFEYHGSTNIHDYGGAVEIHMPSRVQPYLVMTLGGMSVQSRTSVRNYERSDTVNRVASRFAYGAGVGVRYHFSRHVAAFAESRLMRPAVSDADYFVRGTIGLSVRLP